MSEKSDSETSPRAKDHLRHPAQRQTTDLVSVPNIVLGRLKCEKHIIVSENFSNFCHRDGAVLFHQRMPVLGP